MRISLKELKKILSAELSIGSNDDLVLETALIFFDSRKIVENSIFVAIATEKNDGALFIKDAYSKGAVAAIAEHNPDNLPNVLLVKDSIKAFQKLGSYVRSQYQGCIIGITGSSGKTTSKTILAQMLSAFAPVFCGDNAFNNHIGTPYNLCRLDFDTKYAVFEMGMDHAGEISTLVHLVSPNVVAITNVYPMHIEYFSEFKGIAFAKAEIFEDVRPYNGKKIAILNQDTNFADEVLIPKAKRQGIDTIITFGKKGQVQLKNFSFNKLGQTESQIVIDDKTYLHKENVLGERFAYNSTFVAAVASALGLDVTKALEAIESFSPLKGRGKISKINLSENETAILIDDSYNGQPEAVRQAIETLSLMERSVGARKIAIIGRMMELGDHSKEEHISVGKVLANSDIDIVIGVGEETKDLLAQLPDSKQKIYKENVSGLFEELRDSIIRPNDIILVKGSHYASRVFEVSEKLLSM